MEMGRQGEGAQWPLVCPFSHKHSLFPQEHEPLKYKEGAFLCIRKCFEGNRCAEKPAQSGERPGWSHSMHEKLWGEHMQWVER
jgi:hypothetical protein